MKGLSVWELLLFVAPVVGMAIGWLSLKSAKLIDAKTDNELLKGVMTKINEAVWDGVRAIEQSVVKGLKAAKSPKSKGGTSLTEDEIALVKAEVMRLVKGMLTLDALIKVLGLSKGKLDELLETKIEAAVMELRAKEK